MLVSLASLLLAVAVVGVLLRRSESRWVRGAAILACAVLFAVVLDLPLRDMQMRAGRVVAVPVGGDAAEELELLRQGVGRHVEVVAVEGDSPAELRAAAGWLAQASAQGSVVVALVWDGPFASVWDGELGVDAVALAPPGPELEPSHVGVRALGPLQAGRPAALEVSLAGPSRGVAGQVEIRDARGEVVASAELSSQQLGTGSVEVSFQPQLSGRHRVGVRLVRGASEVRGEGEFEVSESASVHVVGSRAAVLARALEVQGLRVQRHFAVPADLDPTTIVVAADPIGSSEQERLATFTADGGGLFLLGAEDGGALPRAGEPLADLLPVTPPPPPAEEEGEAVESAEPPPTPDPEPPPEPTEPELAAGDTRDAKLVEGPEREVERRMVAMVLVIDRSASMRELRQGRSKMDYAKRSAVETAEALTEGDRVGVVTFGLTGQVILAPTPATSLDEIRSKVYGLVADAGATRLANAMDRATALLVDTDLAQRHIVVVSDGEIHDDLEALVAAERAREQGITISLVQIEGDEFVSARVGARIADRGHFFLTDDPSQLPRLVLTEVTWSLGKVGRGAEPETDPSPDVPVPPDPEPPAPRPPRVASDEPEAASVWTVHKTRDSALLAPADAPLPELGGALAVRARRNATSLLWARPPGASEGVPLLAFANRGLGKVGVWTSDLLGPWGQPWWEDSHTEARLAQWVVALAPARAAEPVELLQRVTVSPEAPTADQRAAMERLTGAPLQVLAEFDAPEPSAAAVQRGWARELAWASMLALALLAVVEFFSRRARFGSG